MNEILIKNTGLLPPKITERYEQLYDLIQNESKDGRLEAEKVAKYIGILPLWQYETQCNLFMIQQMIGAGK